MSKARELAELGAEVTVESDGSVGIGIDPPVATHHVRAPNLNGLGKHAAIIADDSNDGNNGGLLITSYQPRLTLNDASAGGKWWDWKVDNDNLQLGYGDPSDQHLREVGGVLSITPGAVVVNEGGQNRDFRVESDNKEHILFVDAGNDVVNINSTQTESLLGATLPDAVNGIRHMKRFYQVEASGYFSSTVPGTTGTRTHTLDVEMRSLQGAVLDLYLTGHYYNNGGSTYFHHYQIYLMCEGTNFRIGNVSSRNVSGSSTGACGAPSVTMASAGIMRITWVTTSGFQLYATANINGPGTGRLHNYSVS